MDRYFCSNPKHPDDSGRYFSVDAGEPASSTYREEDDYINVVLASDRILTKDDVVAKFEVDETKWRLVEFECKTSEGYRKDRSVSWHVKNGEVEQGDVEDSGKMLVVPLYHVRAKFRRRDAEIRIASLLEDFKADAKAHAPIYEPISYPKIEEGLLYEIFFPDVHFGRLTWAQESGADYDIKIADEMLRRVVRKLLSFAKPYPVSRILLPLGNDFFNVDGKEETTARGTPQQEDTRWKKTYTLGRRLLVSIIDMCSYVAPVDVLIIPGNHDAQRMYYLGDSLECWYHANPNVSVDNGPKNRKYHLFGKNLIGFAHGYWEKPIQLHGLMAMEEPEKWAASTHREWHTGDKHHKKDLMLKLTDEQYGIPVRIVRALAGTDTWTYDNGFVGAERSAESFLWHPENGLVAQFTGLA